MDQEIVETAELPVPLEFGPHKFGVELIIDPKGVPDGKTAVVDVETDEKGGFVGIGVMCDPDHVYYYSTLGPDLVAYLGYADLIGHNLKFDARQLQGWGVSIDSSRLIHDTMLKSYVRNSTKESHGLKDLCREFLRMEWPTYDEMTAGGLTLDKIEVERVAAYCGSDCVGTFRLNQYLDKNMTPSQKGYYNTIELPTMQLLFKMELAGVTVDVEYLKHLKDDFDMVSVDLMLQLNDYIKSRNIVIPCVKSCPKKAHEHEFKPKSPKQVLYILKMLGIEVTCTDKAALRPYMGHEFVSLMAECRKVQSMLSKFINAWLAVPTLPTIHTTFSQVSFDEDSGDWKGIRTGRLSSKDPNLQQVKKPDDEEAEEDYGRVLRSSFIPRRPELELWVYDFDQFQYRLLAHYTKEPLLINAFNTGKDCHEETARIILSRDTITKPERRLGKGLNFGAVFGSQPEKIAEIAGCTLEEAEKFYKLYWQRLPFVTRWINRTKMLAHVHKSVKTILGRTIPLPEIDSRNIWDRMHAERQAVNFIIQGSEADIIKLGMLQVNAKGYMPILQVHDELHFEGLPKDRDEHMPKIQSVLENIVKLDIPILANGGYGPNWFAAK